MNKIDISNENFSNYTLDRDLDLLIDLDGIPKARYKWDHYKYDYLNINVPRVTSILSSTIGKEELKKWAASLGDNYQYTMQSILNTGTLVHSMIDDFILLGSRDAAYLGDQYTNADLTQADKAYNNFVNWWFEFHSKGCKITPIAIEKSITCPWYGGTADFIANISYPDGTNYNYILDFKTSKQIGFEYFLQTRMYMNAVNLNLSMGLEKELPQIHGIGIIRVDKIADTTQFVAADIDHDFEFFMNLDYSINSMLKWFYEQISIKSQVSAFKRLYKNREL